MAYWWVNQGNSYKLEYKGGFIWAPIINADGKRFFHWENLADVKAGDIVFSNVDGKVKTIGIALNDAYPSEKSSAHADLWLDEGRRVDIKYFKTINPMSISEIYSVASVFLPGKYSPITGNGDRANQGYLFAVPDEAGDIMLQLLNVPQIVNINPGKRSISDTTKASIIQARVGQGQFRKDLIKRWSGKCIITAFPILSLLTASHIKPWAISTNEERLDPDNGLLLSPNYNSLFDRFLISFSETGELIKSDRISWEDLALLGIKPNSKLNGLNTGNKKYLEYHLEEMLNKKA
jgi:putative restriction endonuclease